MLLRCPFYIKVGVSEAPKSKLGGPNQIYSVSLTQLAYSIICLTVAAEFSAANLHDSCREESFDSQPETQSVDGHLLKTSQ